ncbi:MAG: helix-turn-helix domain-containing protein [Candidatus Riflebacteria bacterium]|nr:helix-turn-helix domain-containing protein [Candidatus Riflebacteria bacterium]
MFKDRLTRILKEKKKLEGITQAEIAKRLCTTPSSISDWKAGRSEPSIDTVHKLATTLNVPVSLLIYDAQPAFVEVDKVVSLKIIETIATGRPFEASKYSDNKILVPEKFAQPGFFAIKVVSDSMFPKLIPGDTVVVAPFPLLENDKTVIVREKLSNELLFFRLKLEEKMILLIPENTAYKTIVLTAASDFKIIGTVMMMQRQL